MNRRHPSFTKRPFYTPDQVEDIAAASLRSVGLLPGSPEPVRIDRFIEKKLGVVPEFESLAPGVLGYTRFGSDGVDAVVVSAELAEQKDVVSQRRVTTTLAHEAGHALLHAGFFLPEAFSQSLFDSEDVSSERVLCRDEDAADRSGVGNARVSHRDRWWEIQANMVMAALLLPRHLVTTAVTPLLTETGMLGVPRLEDGNREAAARLLADVFEVNPVVGRYRLERLFPPSDASQLTL
ncbi:MAG: hypothetical protein WEA09_02345 [Gemmatimonadota bacterium]